MSYLYITDVLLFLKKLKPKNCAWFVQRLLKKQSQNSFESWKNIKTFFSAPLQDANLD